MGVEVTGMVMIGSASWWVGATSLEGDTGLKLGQSLGVKMEQVGRVGLRKGLEPEVEAWDLVVIPSSSPSFIVDFPQTME